MIVGTYSKIFGERQIGLNDESNTANDGQLIAEARSDPAVFARLYRRNYDTVFRYCVHRLFERQTAEDVTAVVFLKVVENLCHFIGDEQQFRNWLYRIATNEVNNHLRRATRREKLLKVTGEQIEQVPDYQRFKTGVGREGAFVERGDADFEAEVPGYHHNAFL